MDTRHSFGANGVCFEALDDFQTRRETDRSFASLCLPLLLGLGGSFAALIYISDTLPESSTRALFEMACLVMGALSILGASIGFYDWAQEDNFLPGGESTAQPPAHVTGLGAALAIALVLFVGGAALVGQLLYGHFQIPEQFGLGVMGLLGFGFLFLTLSPRIGDLFGSSGLLSGLRVATSWLRPAGAILSTLDAWLVHIIAPAVGAMLRTGYWRYLCLFSHVTLGAVFSWFSPAPFGFLGAAWATLAIIAVARRWSWTETERQKLNATPEGTRGPLRVGIEQDLRDEAICGLLLLMLILPIAMRQFYLSAMEPDAFLFEGAVQDSLVAWMGFFGIELVKALPFVDWADIYGADGTARIYANSPIALHAVFTARVLIDLLFLSALLQAVSISVGLSRHKRDFFSGKVNRLDDRIEQYEFARLARASKDGWSFRPEIAAFANYDQRRLSMLRLRARNNRRLDAAVSRVCQLANFRAAPPSQELMELTLEKHPDREALVAMLHHVNELGDFDLDNLAAARRFLNWKSGLEGVRQAVTQTIIRVEPSYDRDEVLMGIVTGDDADSLLGNRVLAVEALAKTARRNPEVIQLLRSVAAADRAKAVRMKANSVLRSAGAIFPGQSVGSGGQPNTGSASKRASV